MRKGGQVIPQIASATSLRSAFNSANVQTCNYGYDDLARIGSVNCGNTIWTQNFGFDVFGNITKTVPTGGTGITFQPTYNNKNRFSALPGFTPTYDNDGNLTADSSHTYSWDAEGHGIGVDAVTVTYDALGRAVEQNRSGSYTQIVYDPLGRKLALTSNYQTLIKGFVYLPGGGTAVYLPNVLPSYYRHPDWLGSSRLATTQSQTVYYDGAYAPYGESYNGSGTTDLNFTGQNQDTVAGLYDFMFREYAPVQGRWVSPDPAGLAAADPTNPQTWNRYGYVANNPLSKIDPKGLYDCNDPPADAGDNCADLGAGGEFYGGQYSGSWSQGAWNGWEERGFFGDRWYDLPAQQNPAAQSARWEAQYAAQVALAFALADAAQGDPAIGACIAKGLQSVFPQGTVTAGNSTGEVGGHWNFALILQFSSYNAANDFYNSYMSTFYSGFGPPARFGSGPALHLENVDGPWSVQDGTYSIGATAHIDLFNPNPASLGGGGLLGFSGHVFDDGAWGHIVQFFGGNIDPGACPF